MPPCGSPLISTMKSVSLPVSRLAASSVTISDEPGETSSLMRSSASGGMVIRSSAALAAINVRHGRLRCAQPPLT